MRYFINSLIVLFPMQYFALEIGTTKFDLFNILFLFFFPFAAFNFRFKKNNLLVFGCYIFLCGVLLLNSSAQYPVYRFLSSFLWLTLALFVFLNSYEFYYPKLFSLINTLGLILLFGIMLQKLFFLDARPKLFFSEPSLAGLIMYGYSFVFFYLVFVNKFVKINLIKGVVFLCGGLLTESAHLITFLILIVLVFSIKFKFRYFIMLVFLGIFTFNFIPESLLNKFNLGENIDDYSLSQLSWLQGYNQAISSVKLNPFIGQGFGSTGYNSFFSEYEEVLQKSDLADLNRYDGYSLFFRWVIELGFLVTIVIVLYFILKLINGLRHNKEGESDRFVIFLFGFFIFFGSLVKEPNYGFSTFLLSFYLMGMFINTKGAVNNAMRSQQFSAKGYQDPPVASPCVVPRKLT